MLHVWEFRDDKISGDNIWLDSAAIINQLPAHDRFGTGPGRRVDFFAAVTDRLGEQRLPRADRRWPALARSPGAGVPS